MPNPPPGSPPNTPCCDGVCNHGYVPSRCGCSPTGGPCSGNDFLYGPDCCTGLMCLSNGTCGTCKKDGESCGGSSLNCCNDYCNFSTGLCGTSPIGGTCEVPTDCATSALCKKDPGVTVGICTLNDGAACTADAQCYSGICDAATGKCGCGMDGTSCTRAVDCCGSATMAPTCNSVKTCGCVAAGVHCGVNGDCCGGSVCNSATTSCGCSKAMGACNSNTDCCSGTTCGAAKTCCKASGALCGAAGECCSGSCKGNGTCQ